MPRKTRQKAAYNPLVIGLSSLIAILLITSASFDTPIVSFVVPSGESTSLNFSMVGLPLLALLVLIIFMVKVKK